MEIVIPARDHGKAAQRYTWDEDGAVRHVALESISEGTEHHSASSVAPRGQWPPSWPFHHRGASEVPSTPVTSHFRKATAQTKSFFRAAEDSASLLSRSLVPDYVVNYIRGETPETLARKKEQRQWGERGIEITPQRDRFVSQVVEFDDPWSSQTQLAPNEYANEDQQRGFRRLFTGWRGGLTFNIILTILILVAAVICLILVASKSKILSGEATIFSGSCTMASGINTGLHVAINILTIILLAGGNYFLQVASSPMRHELAVAHNKKRWLDIGIPSLRNFRHVSGFRASLAFVVLLAAVATQVILNTVVYTTQSGLDYEVAFVTEPFLNGAQFSNGTENNYGGLSRLELLSLQEDASQSKLVNLTTTRCAQEFGGVFQASFDAVLLVVSTGSATETSLVQTARSGSSLKAYSQSTSMDTIALDGSLVQYCLARQGSSETCTVDVSSAMLGVVALLNLATILSIALLLSRSKFEPLATLGDAIRSFLRNPDPETKGTCLMTKTDVQQGRWGFKEAKYFIPTEHFWFLSPSLSRWALTIFSWLLLAAPTAVALGLVMSTDPAGLLTPFGVATPYTTFVTAASISTVQMAVLASVPQVLLAILYLTTNSLLTTYYLSHEFSLFAMGPRPLRVSSDPAGAQTTSLYLTLPRPVSWLVLAFFAAMGFVLSQAVFPAVIVLSPSSNSLPNPLVAISFSTQALLVLVALLTALVLVLLALGLRRAPAAVLVNGLPKGNPAVLRGGSCSAVISAKCQPVPSEAEPWRQSVSWGVVTEAVGMLEGRCAFSAKNVGAVDVGRCYA